MSIEGVWDPEDQLSCPDGYLMNAASESCYQVKTTEQNVSLAGADRVCQKDGARIASIRDKKEDLFIMGKYIYTAELQRVIDK